MRRIAQRSAAGDPRRPARALRSGVGNLRRRGARGLVGAFWGWCRRNPRRSLPLAAVLAAVVTAVLVLTFVSAPYYALYPGDVYSATGAVSSDSEPTYEPMSLIGFVTISAHPTESLWQWVVAYLDDSVTLQHEDVFNRGLTPQERRNTDARLMTRSQDLSVYVALAELGYDLPDSQVVVSGLIPCMPAAEHITIGDVITSVGGEPVSESSEVSSAVRSREVGELVEFGLRRQDETESVVVDIRLGSSADECIDPATRTTREDERPLLGVILANDVGDLGVDVDFATGNIAGPSAGLAFSLSVVDLLSPGELTEGRPVAVTGTISPDGSVGTVGGIAQKVQAVEQRNFRLMLVPPGQYEEAAAAASEALEIVEVSSMAEAMAVVAPNWSPPER
ncbi:MAG: PDZ domain-containing protein [bacterium]|nr:PDZ domain-containing protein [bacterium]